MGISIQFVIFRELDSVNRFGGGGGETGFINLFGNIQGIGQFFYESVMFYRQFVDVVLERGMAFYRLKEV